MKSRPFDHSRSSLLTLGASCLVVALAAGCQAQNDGSYQGDAQATLRGTIRNALTSVPPDAELAIVWQSPPINGPDGKVHGGGLLAAEKATVTPTFPSNFQVEIHLPPPDTAIWDRYSTGTPVAAAELVVMRAGTVHSGPLSSDDYNAGLLALADDTIFYLPAAPTPYGGAVLGGVSTAGFHLVGVDPVATYDMPDQARLDACQALATTDAEKKACLDLNFLVAYPDGFDHSITIVMKDPPKAE
jgi:hypothetical protein